MTIPWIDPVAVMDLVEKGISHRIVAQTLGISRTRVGQIARQYEQNAAGRREVKRLCPPVPAWVIAAKLTEDYRDTARDFGEHAAARHCRALLAEMRRVAA